MSASVWNGGDPSATIADADNSFKFERIIADTTGQTLCVLTSFAYSINTGSLEVRLNGIPQAPVIDFTETSPSSFTMVEALEAGDIIDVLGRVGFSGAQNAATSAAQAAASASAAATSYQQIQTLGIPSLPLDITNGGTKNGLINKGDLLSSTGAAVSRIALGVDGATLTADSTSASGLKWTYDTSKSKVFAVSNGALMLSGVSNVNYVGVTATTLTIDATAVGVNLNNILRISNLGGNTFTTTSADGSVVVNLPANTELQLINKSMQAGIWAGGVVTYGAAYTGSNYGGDTYLGSFLFDANSLIVVSTNSVSGANSLYVSLFNPTTKVFVSQIVLARTGLSGSADQSVANNCITNLFKVDASTVLLSNCWTAATNDYFALLTIVSGVSISLGTSTSPVRSSNYSGASPSQGHKLLQLAPAQYLLVYNAFGGNNTAVLKMLTISSGAITISAATSVGIGVSPGGTGVIHVDCAAVGTTGFILLCLESSVNKLFTVACTYAGTAITLGTGTNIGVTLTSAGLVASLIPVPSTTDTFLHVQGNTANQNMAYAVKVTGTAVSIGVGANMGYAAGDAMGTYVTNLPKYLRTDWFRAQQYNWSYVGTTILLYGTRGMMPATVAGTTTTVGAGTGSVTATQFAISVTTGKIYYTQSGTTLIRNVGTTSGSTSVSPVTYSTNAPITNPALFVNESLYDSTYHTYNGTTTITTIGNYPLGNVTNIDIPLTSDGKWLIANGSVVNKYLP